MTKAELHRLVDALPEESVPAVAIYMERVRDPMVAILDAAPPDDEPYTTAEQEEDARAIEGFLRGEGKPLDDVMGALDSADPS